MASKESQEFLEKKTLTDLKHKLEKYRHKLTMEELTFRRDSDITHHNLEMERMRIKTAEIKKTIIMRNER